MTTTKPNPFSELFIECRHCHTGDMIEVTGTKHIAICHRCGVRFRTDWKERSKKKHRPPPCKTCSTTPANEAPPGWKCPECAYVMAGSQDGLRGGGEPTTRNSAAPYKSHDQSKERSKP